MLQHIEASLERIMDEWLEDHLGVIVEAGVTSTHLLASPGGSQRVEWVWLNAAGDQIRQPIEDWYAAAPAALREGDALLHARAGTWPLAMRMKSTGAEPLNGRDLDWWRRIRRIRLDEAANALLRAAKAGQWSPRPLACKVVDGVMRTLEEAIPALGVSAVLPGPDHTMLAPVVLPPERDGLVGFRNLSPNHVLGGVIWVVVVEEIDAHLTFELVQARPLDIVRQRLAAATQTPGWRGLLIRGVTPESVTETLGAYWSTTLVELQRQIPHRTRIQTTLGEGHVTHHLLHDKGGLLVTHPLPARDPRVATSEAWLTDTHGEKQAHLGSGWGIAEPLREVLLGRWAALLTSGQEPRLLT